MPSQPVNDIIDLSVNDSKVFFDVSSFLGYSFDLNINSDDAEGILEVYCQNTNPINDTYLRVPIKSYTITGGTYGGGKTSQVIDSAFLTVADYCVVIWRRTDGTGTIDVIGTRRVFF